MDEYRGEEPESSVAWVVRLAKARKLSPIYEREWIRQHESMKMNANPVELALKFAEQEIHNRYAWIGAGVLLAVIAILATTVSGASTTYAQATLMVTILGLFVGGLAIPFIIVHHPPLREKKYVHRFCEVLAMFADWAQERNPDWSAVPMDEEGIKRTAKTILVNAAEGVLNMELACAQYKQRTDEILEREQFLVAARERFQHRHDVLAEMGLVAGGYRRFFEEAEKKLK